MQPTPWPPPHLQARRSGSYIKPCAHTATSGALGREEQLQELFARHAALLEVRMVRDHFSGAPRGFAFAHFHTVGDAANALSLLQVGPGARSPACGVPSHDVMSPCDAAK